jgi:glycine cleavage system H protein
MTTVATAMAGQLVAFTPRKAGRAVETGKSCATVESGKWVGPAKTAAGGELVAVNDGLIGKPSLANEDPYVAGWMVILKPRDWARSSGLVVGGSPQASQDGGGQFAGCTPSGARESGRKRRRRHGFGLTRAEVARLRGRSPRDSKQWRTLAADDPVPACGGREIGRWKASLSQSAVIWPCCAESAYVATRREGNRSSIRSP